MKNSLKNFEHRMRRLADETLVFMLAFVILMPWAVVSYTASTFADIRENGVTSLAYAESYSSVTSSVTSNGTTIVKSASSTGTSSASVSINNTLNNSDSTITILGEDIKTNTETKVDMAGDEVHIRVLTELLGKLKELLALLTKGA